MKFKKKFLALSVTSLVFVAFALVMLFIPFTTEDKDWSYVPMKLFFDIEALIEAFEDIVDIPFVLYPIVLLITAISVVKSSIKNIQFATKDENALPKKAHNNFVALLLFGILAWALAIVVFIDEHEALAAFTYAPLVYVLPAIALMIVGNELKLIHGVMKKETEKKAKAEAEANSEVVEEK